MRSDSDLHEPRTNAEQSETAGDFRVSHESREMLYFIRAGDFVKIGRTSDLDRRVAALQCGCPYLIDGATAFPGFAHLEHVLHRILAAHRVHHGEWFRWHEDVEREIEKLTRRARSAERRRLRHAIAYFHEDEIEAPPETDWREGSPLYAPRGGVNA